MKRIVFTIALIFGIFQFAIGQENYSAKPSDAKFVTQDVERFWKAFDNIDSLGQDAFADYIENGTEGVKGFTKYRIENANALYKTVNERKKDYLKSRNVLDDLDTKKQEIIKIYEALEELYPDAVFPPIYYVVGRFNSGGTVSDAGIILGTEMLENLDGLPGLVAHELIHYQQNFKGKKTLLFQSLKEGSADFIGELISGTHINKVAFDYGEAHSEMLTREFVKKMKNKKFKDWLYQTSEKDDRPNDLGYWMGYKITKAYYDRQADKTKAIFEILNIKDPSQFTKKSGYLDEYWK
ncbi:DUF2268 domain-containing putative Zn-dependent protease [Neolewinella persica]|uniref:DUF2268 domain-containing putative Zn-dependent protease n=1 Tax=Neolewinella persica TaxID=70998 RepID=UPI00037AAD6A|nr:DUF2268 domain-containing putative Zn-dependent protease [Neolewinella persica]